MTVTEMKRPATTGMRAAFLAMACLLPATANADAKGLEIAKKVDEANEGFGGEVSEMEMVLINAYGDRTTRRMTSTVLEVLGDGDKSKIEFLWPADVKGTRMLTWAHKRDDDDQWLYLPAIKRTKRISSSNKSGSFMGSEFSYEDLGSQEVEKFTHTFLEDTTLGDREVWKMKRVPADARSGYARQLLWIDKQYMNPLKIEYYDRKNELLKTSALSGYERFDRLWRVGKIAMVNHQTKKRSELVWKSRSLHVELDEDDFDSDGLDF